MAEKEVFHGAEKAGEKPISSNVKPSQKYDRFGETIRYLTLPELQQFFDATESYRHKLMMQMVYELGCRVGEFVRIQLKHLNFSRDTILFPEENTKTGRRRFNRYSQLRSRTIDLEGAGGCECLRLVVDF